MDDIPPSGVLRVGERVLNNMTESIPPPEKNVDRSPLEGALSLHLREYYNKDEKKNMQTKADQNEVTE